MVVTFSMRREDNIQKGIETIENRIDRDSQYMEQQHPLAPLVMSVHQAKRAALHQIRDAENGEHWEMYDNLVGGLSDDLELAEYTQVQAMINAHEWAQGNLDAL